jgi:ABC-type transport system involved in multi-copper enzyme maturation permease subunit
MSNVAALRTTVATEDADRISQWPAFRSIARKEVLDHVRGRRFILGAAMSMILCLLAGYLRTEDFRQAHQERNLFLQRWTPSVLEQLQRDETIEVENTRAVSPLSLLSTGLEATTPFRFTSTKEGLKLGQSRGAQNPVDALFGALDLSFIAATLLSLLAITFTFDSVCGERAQGTLALLLSYPVKRSTFLAAKISGNVAVAALCFLPGLLCAFLVPVASGVPIMNGWHWLAYAVVATLYLSSFVVAGVAVSARGGKPVDAALTALFFWVIVVFVLPRGVGLVVNHLRPATHIVEIGIREDEAVSQLRIDYIRRLDAAFDAYLGSDSGHRNDDFDRARAAAAEELRRQRRVVLAKMWDEQRREEDLREAYVRTLSAFSPAALFQQAAAELAWTGTVQRRHFLLEARNYDERIGRRLAESREFYYGRGAANQGRALVIHDDIKPFLIPFQPTWAPSREIFAAITAPVCLLLMFILLGTAAGFRAIERLDVRS